MIWPIELKIKNLISKNKLPIASVAACVVVVWLVVWFVRLFATPDNYNPSAPIHSSEVSRYLTNHLGPELHNKAQYREPFNLVVDEYGINDIIARGFNNQQFDGIKFQEICIAFEPEGLCLIGKCEYKGFRFVATLVVKPEIDKNGNFLLHVKKVKAGRSRLPFATMIIKKKIAGRLEKAASKKLFGDISELLLNDGTVKPTMKVGGVKIRAEKIETVKDKMIIYFVPAK